MLINPNIAIIESLPGVGGDESKLWMEELLSSYLRFAQKKGFSLVVMKDPQKKLARIKTRPSPDLDLTPVYEKIKKVDTKGYWFLHILKNMLLNGSSRTPDAVPTPLTLQKLIEIIKEV